MTNQEKYETFEYELMQIMATRVATQVDVVNLANKFDVPLLEAVDIFTNLAIRGAKG